MCLLQHTSEICGGVRIAGSFVLGHLRIRAERTSHYLCRVARNGSRADELRRSDSLFDPLFKRSEAIETDGAGPAATVAHTRNHEQPVKVFNRLRRLASWIGIFRK